MTNAMEGDFLNTGQNVLEASIDEGTRALTMSVAAFAASWRDSNCTIRADDHRKQKNYQDKDSGNQNRGILEVCLTRYRGVRLG